jgi:predicted outer membrane repeat protein
MRPIFVLALALPTPALAVTLTVGPAGYTTISEALLVAVDGDVIEVEAGDYPETLTIPVEVTITGLGGLQATSLSGTGAPAVVVDGVTATLEGFTINPTAESGIVISNGASFTGNDLDISGFIGIDVEEGLAVHSTDSEVYLNDVVLDGNEGPLDGSAVQLTDSLAVLTRLTVTRNISGADGAIATDFAHVFIEDSYFEGNHAIDDGGALDVDNGSEVQVDQCTFVGNTSTNSSAAINAQGGGTLTVQNSTFTENVAGGDGGAIRVRLGTTGDLKANYFSENIAVGHGGAVDLSDTTTALTDNVYILNEANAGGAVYGYQTGILVIDGDTYDANTATEGGAIRTGGTIATDIQISTFLSNTASINDGGAIRSDLDGASLTVSHSTFVGNTSTNDGGAVSAKSVLPSILTLDNNHFSSNTADDDGGGIYVETIDEVRVTANFFCANDAIDNGGAATVIDSGITTNLWLGNAVIENTSGDSGGGFYFDGIAMADLSNHTFLANTSADGGHLRADRATMNLVNNIFAGGPGGDGVTQDNNNGVRDYNLWFDNSNNDVGGQLDNNDLGGNSLFLDPEISSFLLDGDCTNDDLTLVPGSPAIDAGDPTISDRDGSPSDIGAHGGPNALPEDADQDGFSAQQDCDDTDPAVNPLAEEICDGIDNNCDGRTDGDNAVGAIAWYYDGDMDGYGEDLTERFACYNPGPFVEVPGDCDDTDAMSNPGATEICDGADNNCDGTIDEGVLLSWYDDADGDGFGDDDLVTEACEGAAGQVDTGGDCDDNDETISPAAEEICDALDNDCDGEADEGLLETWYEDADGDGLGDDASTVEDCTPVDGHSLEGGDCDDTDPDVQDTCDEDGKGGGKKDGGGCGCSAAPSAPSGLLLCVPLAAAFARRRRSRSA